VDHICNSIDFMGGGFVDGLYHGRHHSCPAGGRYYCDPDPGGSRTKTGVIRGTFAGQRERLKKEIGMKKGELDEPHDFEVRKRNGKKEK
jgi:hypothetical protein